MLSQELNCVYLGLPLSSLFIRNTSMATSWKHAIKDVEVTNFIVALRMVSHVMS